MSVDQVYDRIAGATNRLTDHRIEPFSGTTNPSIDEWLEEFEDFATARRWDELTKKEQLPTFFIGSARRWLSVRRQQPPMYRPQGVREPLRGQKFWSELTWNDIMEEAKTHFLPQGYREHLRDRLNRQQSKGEDIISFYDEKLYVAGKLGRTTNETIRAIKRSLLPEYMTLVGVSRDSDLYELLANLKEAELIIRKSSKRRDDEWRDNKQQTKQITAQEDGMESKRCYNCNQFGHIGRNCGYSRIFRDQRRNFEPPYRSRGLYGPERREAIERNPELSQGNRMMQSTNNQPITTQPRSLALTYDVEQDEWEQFQRWKRNQNSNVNAIDVNVITIKPETNEKFMENDGTTVRRNNMETTEDNNEKTDEPIRLTYGKPDILCMETITVDNDKHALEQKEKKEFSHISSSLSKRKLIDKDIHEKSRDSVAEFHAKGSNIEGTILGDQYRLKDDELKRKIGLAPPRARFKVLATKEKSEVIRTAQLLKDDNLSDQRKKEVTNKEPTICDEHSLCKEKLNFESDEKLRDQRYKEVHEWIELPAMVRELHRKHTRKKETSK